jgi:hypothetical protein
MLREVKDMLNPENDQNKGRGAVTPEYRCFKNFKLVTMDNKEKVNDLRKSRANEKSKPQ